MAKETDVIVLAELRLLPDSIEQGKRGLIEFARTVIAREPDCLAIDVAHNLEDPTRITLIEKWADRRAYEGPHLKTPHMKAFIEHSGKYFDGPAVVSIGKSTDIAGKPIRDAAPYGR